MQLPCVELGVMLMFFWFDLFVYKLSQYYSCHLGVLSILKRFFSQSLNDL